MEISKCKYCGSYLRPEVFQEIRIIGGQEENPWYCMCSNPECGHRTQPCSTKSIAEYTWENPTLPPVTTVLDNTSTDYRDRVDRMVAALVSCNWMSDETCKHLAGQEAIINIAVELLDAVDVAIKERENTK